MEQIDYILQDAAMARSWRTMAATFGALKCKGPFNPEQMLHKALLIENRVIKAAMDAEEQAIRDFAEVTHA